MLLYGATDAQVSFMGTPATRGVLLKPLRKMVKELAHTKVTEEFPQIKCKRAPFLVRAVLRLWFLVFDFG